MTEYFRLLNESWGLLRKNPVLFLPLLIALLLGLGFLFFVLIQLVVMLASFGFNLSSIAFSSAEEMITGFIRFWPVILVIGIADFFILIIMLAYVRAMQIGAYRDAVLGKKVTAENIFSYGRQYFKKYLLTNLIRILLFLPVIIIAVVFIFLFALTPHPEKSFISGVLPFYFPIFFLFILLVIYAIVLAFLLYFLDPIFSYQKLSGKLSPWGIIKNSFNYTKNNLGHMLLAFLVTLLVSVVVSIALAVIFLPVELLKSVSFSAYLPARIIQETVQWIVSAILGVFLDLFLFSCYFRK